MPLNGDLCDDHSMELGNRILVSRSSTHDLRVERRTTQFARSAYIDCQCTQSLFMLCSYIISIRAYCIEFIAPNSSLPSLSYGEEVCPVFQPTTDMAHMIRLLVSTSGSEKCPSDTSCSAFLLSHLAPPLHQTCHPRACLGCRSRRHLCVMLPCSPCVLSHCDGTGHTARRMAKLTEETKRLLLSTRRLCAALRRR